MSKCLRCAQCCVAIGRTFWKHGDFTDYPELARLAQIRESVDDGLPCEMLDMVCGVASCRIQREYGKKAKPKVCRDYPPSKCKTRKIVGRPECCVHLREVAKDD